MKINEITLDKTMIIDGDPARIRVGEAVIEGGHTVDKINYHPSNRLFNKGLEIGIACYAVYFTGIGERRLIAVGTVTGVEVIKDMAPVNAEANIPLPD